MSNIRQNGFGCPYCREEMVEEKNEEPDDQSEISYITQEQVENYDDSALTNMRILFQQIEGEEVEPEQEAAESEQEETQQEPEDQVPPVDMIMRKLIGSGVTYEDLVKHVLLEHDEYEFDRNFEVSADKIFGTVRIFVSNYEQSQQPEPQPEPRFRNIFTTSTMPDFESMTTEELKTICRDYGIRYRMRSAVTKLTSIWRIHNEA